MKLKVFFFHIQCVETTHSSPAIEAPAVLSTQKTEIQPKSPTLQITKWRKRVSQTFSAQKDAKLDIIKKKKKKTKTNK